MINDAFPMTGWWPSRDLDIPADIASDLSADPVPVWRHLPLPAQQSTLSEIRYK